MQLNSYNWRAGRNNYFGFTAYSIRLRIEAAEQERIQVTGTGKDQRIRQYAEGSAKVQRSDSRDLPSQSKSGWKCDWFGEKQR